MELKDLKPKRSKFNLKSTGREYYLRPVNLEDEIWIQQEFGNSIVEIFTDDSVDMIQLSRIIFHQLEDKSDFKKQEVTIIDEEGEESFEMIGGCKLLHRMIVGIEDKISIILAFNETMGASRPDGDEGDDDDLKKKSKPIGD